jgi:hypothetical protein
MDNDIAKIPAWSALVIVPVIIFGACLKTVQRAESPVSLGVEVGCASFVVALIVWGLLVLFYQLKR